MDPGQLIGTHGYWVLALGCLLEGETLLVIAGYAAHRGYLDPLAVIAVASLAGFAGDQFYFWVGRRHGPALLARFPALAAKAGRVHALLDRYQALAVVGVRFAYGLRVAGPLLIGTSPMSALRFAALNALGAVLWACLVGGIGWVFGRAAEAVLGDIRHAEGWILLGLAGVGALVWWLRGRRNRQARS
jgi:membrane protein DedA with SNARE-associated domain